MPNHDKPLPGPVPLPEALEEAYDSINRAYDCPEQLLHADVTEFEELSCAVFGYFNRDEVFYLNPTARAMLSLRLSPLDGPPPRMPPIFWLDDDEGFAQVDQLVWTRRQAFANARELVTLAWGKTWLEGIKLPILSVTGQPIALLFAGLEAKASQQIRRAATQYQLAHTGFGDN